MKSKWIVYILATLLVGGPVYSQSCVFRNLSGVDGLSDLIVSAIYKDSCGYVWFGTATSVERFDGVHFKHYPIFGNNEKRKWVNTIMETAGNKIWVGNDMGLWQVGAEKLERVAEDVINSGVRSIVQADDGTLYIGSETGLFVWRNGKVEHIRIDTNVFSSANFVIGLNIGEGGTLWMITKGGLYSMSRTDRKMVHHANHLAEKETNYSYRNMTRIGSTLYLGTMGQGIVSFDTKTHQFSPYINIGCNIVMALSGDGKDMLYAGTDGNGVHFISTKQRKVVDSFRYSAEAGKGLASNSVYSLLVDRDGLIWVGTYQFGVDYTVYQSELFSVYETPYFSSRDIAVHTIYMGGDKKLIGSRNGLFYIDEAAGQVTRFTASQLRSTIITCSYDFRDKIYIGTYGGGMYVFDKASQRLKDFDSDRLIPFVNGHVFCLNSDAHGDLWIGTSDGIYRYRDGQLLDHFSAANSQLPEGNVYVIYFDSTRKGWICTENGICIWDPASGSIKTGIFPEGFVHEEKICMVYEDSGHQLYFLPYKGALSMSDLSMRNFRRMRPGTPLEGKDILSIVEDREGWLWIGTSNGLYRYDKKDTFIPYSFADGLPSSSFLACTPVEDEHHTIWFGNSKGLVGLSADYRKKKANRTDYKIGISSVYANGKQVENLLVKTENNTYEISLNTVLNNVTIGFSAFTFTDPAYMAYEYQLEGVDQDWQSMTGKQDVTYYNLSPGTHHFRVRRMGMPATEAHLYIHMFSFLNWRLWGFVLMFVVAAAMAYWVWKKKRRVVSVAAKADDAGLSAEEKYRTNNLSLEECAGLAENLKKIMNDKKPYINPDLKIAELASLIGVSSYTLSYLFNQHLKQSYYDYVNDYRIAEFKRLVQKGEYSKYTLDTLMELCGFSSRTSFFRCFKKVNGITPSEYIKRVEHKN